MSAVITPSGLYYPNNIARIYLEATQKVLGAEATAHLLQDLGMAQYIDNFPPNNFQRQFDFAYFSALAAGLDALPPRPEIKGPLSGEVGRRCFKEGNKAFGGLSALGPIWLGFRSLPTEFKVKNGLIAMAVVFSTLSDQRSDVQEHDDHYDYIIHCCPVCWGRHSDQPICATASAMLEEGLYWATQQRIKVVETQCCAVGDDTCTFAIPKNPDT
jgi:predicted hydrocarbon binding protein